MGVVAGLGRARGWRSLKCRPNSEVVGLYPEGVLGCEAEAEGDDVVTRHKVVEVTVLCVRLVTDVRGRQGGAGPRTGST